MYNPGGHASTPILRTQSIRRNPVRLFRGLRKQLAFYQEDKQKPRRLSDGARITLLFWFRWFDWRQALTVVQPETLIHWHRRGSKSSRVTTSPGSATKPS
jgi:hypothetical protein